MTSVQQKRCRGKSLVQWVESNRNMLVVCSSFPLPVTFPSTARPLTVNYLFNSIVISISATATGASVAFAPSPSTFSSNAAKYGYDTPVASTTSGTAAAAAGKYPRSATVPRPQPQPRRPSSRVEAINHFVRPASTTFAADYRKR